MIHTKKKYTYNSSINKFIEDENGLHEGFQWTDDNGVLCRTILTKITFDIINQVAIGENRFEVFVNATAVNDWRLEKIEESRATIHDYINSLSGVFEPNPWEDDLSKPISESDPEQPIYNIPGDPESGIIGYAQVQSGYEKKLKLNMYPQYLAVHQALMSMFERTIEDVQSRKYGATSFN